MLEPSFINWTAEFFKQETIFDWVEETCDPVSMWTFDVQICCTEWELFVNSCWVKYTTWKDITIKVNPDFPVDSGANRHKYTFKLNDCIGYMWKFQVEDITCVKLPYYWINSYKIIWFKFSEND